jgi:hypothetical protein
MNSCFNDPADKYSCNSPRLLQNGSGDSSRILANATLLLQSLVRCWRPWGTRGNKRRPSQLLDLRSKRKSCRRSGFGDQPRIAKHLGTGRSRLAHTLTLTTRRRGNSCAGKRSFLPPQTVRIEFRRMIARKVIDISTVAPRPMVLLEKIILELLFAI